WARTGSSCRAGGVLVARRRRLRLSLEVLRGGMVEDERRHGGLRVHHEALREVQADRLGLEQAEEDLLVREVRARRVAEGDADPPVSALELLADRQVGRIRKPPERP